MLPLPILAGFWEHFRDAVWCPWRESVGARLCQCAGFPEKAERRDRLHLDVLGSLKLPSLFSFWRGF